MWEFILIFVLLYLVLQILYLNVYSKRIRNVTGPFIFPIVTTIPQLITKKDFGEWIGINFQKYGDNFFTSHRILFGSLYNNCLVMTLDPKIVNFMNSNLDIFVRVMPTMLETKLFKLLFGDGIFYSDGENWRYQRYFARPMFKKEKINQMKEIFREKSEIVLKILGEKEKSGSILNAIELFSAYTLDSFCKIAFGANVNSLEHSVPFQSAFDGAIKYTMDIFIDPMAKHNTKEYLKQLQIIDDYVYGLIDSNTGQGTDLLSTLKNSKDGDGKPFPRKWIRDILCNFLIAGRDTTSLLITYTFYYLSLNPHIEKKLVEEIKQNCTGPIPSDDSVANCQYLDMVINETLRLSPSVPATYRYVCKDVTLPNGIKLFKGDTLSYSQYYMHRNPKYWDNPEQYLPERWKDKQLLINPSFIPFHSGEMQCLGRYMAKVEAKALIAAILLHYHLELVPGEKVDPYFGLLLQVKNVKMYVKPQTKSQ